MTLKEIQELIKMINKYDLSEFSMKESDFELRIRTNKFIKESSVQSSVSTPLAPIMASPAPASPPPKVTLAPTVIPEADKPVEAEQIQELIEVKSPIVGTFYRSSSPEKPPYIKVGDVIEVGSVVCIVEAMKLFNEIESEVSGKVVKVVIDDASPVEYDQVLFLVDPKG